MATIFVANALAARILNDVPMTNESKTTKTGVTITMSQCRGTSMKNVVKTLSLNILFAALCLGF
ncbi:MAG: hypothetical protein PVF34_10505, partial [Gammaproteobacteria bacterium]